MKPLHKVKVDASAITGKRPHRARSAPHGELKRSLVRSLKAAKGQPVTTIEIVLQFVRQNNIDLNKVKQADIMDSARKCLGPWPTEVSCFGVIRLHEVNDEPSKIEGKLPYGPRVNPRVRLKPAIIACLKKANGSSLFTSEIMYGAVKACGMNIEDCSLPQLRKPVRNALQKLAVQGKVVRHHELLEPTEGCWSLKRAEVTGN